MTVARGIIHVGVTDDDMRALHRCRVCGRWYRIRTNLLACLTEHESQIRATRDALDPPQEWEQDVDPGGVTPY